jgi:hypothetical protein
MVEKVIKITVDSSKAEANLKKIKSETKDVDQATSKLTGTLDNLTGGAVTKLKGFVGGLKGVSLGFKSVGAAIAASGIGLLVVIIAAITAAFKGSEEGQNKFAKLMGVIGAVVGNVVDVLADLGDFIIDLFSGNGKAMTQLKSFGSSIFNVLGLPIKNVIDTVKALGKAMGALFDGDIKGAFDAIKQGALDVGENFAEAKAEIIGATDAVKGFIEQNIIEAKLAADVADKRAKADKIERGLLVERAKAERDMAELRLKARDLNNTTAEERQTALNEVLRISDDLIAKEVEIAQLRADAQVAENGFARSNKENLDAEEQAKAKVIQLETARLNQQRTIQRELTQAENAIASEQKARSKERQDRLDADAAADKKRIEEIDKFTADLRKKNEDLEAETLEAKLELERTRAEEALERLVGDETEKREALLELNAYYDQLESDLMEKRAEEAKAADAKAFKEFSDNIDKQLKAEEEAAAEKQKIQDEGFERQKEGIEAIGRLSGDLFSLVDNLGKQDEKSKEKRAKTGFVVQKALNLSLAGIDATKAIINSLSQSPIAIGPVPSPAGIASLAFASATGLASIAKIATAKFESGISGGGGGAGSPPSFSAPAAAPAFNLVEGSGTNQIAESIGGQNKPLQAFVVSSEVTTAQGLDRNIVDNSGF